MASFPLCKYSRSCIPKNVGNPRPTPIQINETVYDFFIDLKSSLNLLSL